MTNDKSLPTAIYYVNVSDNLYKVGITQKESVIDRFTLNDQKNIKEIDHLVLPNWYYAYSLEQYIISKFRKYLWKQTKPLKSGNTEIFSTDILSFPWSATTISDSNKIINDISYSRTIYIKWKNTLKEMEINNETPFNIESVKAIEKRILKMFYLLNKTLPEETPLHIPDSGWSGNIQGHDSPYLNKQRLMLLGEYNPFEQFDEFDNLIEENSLVNLILNKVTSIEQYCDDLVTVNTLAYNNKKEVLSCFDKYSTVSDGLLK